MNTAKTATGVKTRLLDAAVYQIRAKGYSGTTVDDLCLAAGVTKGGFFHHFKNKEELAVAAAHHFASMADGLFRQAFYRRLADPLERVLGYVEFRKSILQGELPQYTCLLGTMVQEAYDTHPAIRAACEECIWGNAAMVQVDIEEAIERYGIAGDWSAESLALHTQAVIQGAFILAKAKHGAGVATDSLDHLRRYLQLLFNTAAKAA
jgi:TetR/AcrR family transcriptional repressor of nem operon